jgi:Flp pilus assembly protein TadB
MSKHNFWMIIGCAIPLLLLFIAPLLGLNNSITLFFFIIAMFACHIMMIGHHRKGHEHMDHQH